MHLNDRDAFVQHHVKRDVTVGVGGEKRPANARDRAERERAAAQENLPPEYLLPGYMCPVTPLPESTSSSNTPKPSRRTLPLTPLQPLSQADLKACSLASTNKLYSSFFYYAMHSIMRLCIMQCNAQHCIIHSFCPQVTREK